MERFYGDYVLILLQLLLGPPRLFFASLAPRFVCDGVFFSPRSDGLCSNYDSSMMTPFLMTLYLDRIRFSILTFFSLCFRIWRTRWVYIVLLFPVKIVYGTCWTVDKMSASDLCPWFVLSVLLMLRSRYSRLFNSRSDGVKAVRLSTGAS